MTNYRHILKEKLAERCRVNTRYSLRAFARDLGIAPSILSEVMNGKHGFSKVKANQIVEKLGLSPEEQTRFLALVTATDARSRKDREEASVELTKHDQTQLAPNPLTMDAFRVISDVYHFAIMEYLQLSKRDHDPYLIGQALKQSVHVIQDALERLIRLEMIEKREDRYKVLTPLYFSPTGIPSEAIKNFHRQILEKAAQALTMQSLDQREFRGLVFAVNRKKIPETKEKIKAFVREINEESLRDAEKDSVYCLSVQLFEMT